MEAISIYPRPTITVTQTDFRFFVGSEHNALISQSLKCGPHVSG